MTLKSPRAWPISPHTITLSISYPSSSLTRTQRVAAEAEADLSPQLLLDPARIVMATKLKRGSARGAAILLLLLAAVLICNAASNVFPVSDSHRSAALELFALVDGSFGSLEESYEALHTFEVLGIDRKPDVPATCTLVSEVLGSSSSPVKDLFYALKVSSILKCGNEESLLKGITSRLKSTLSDASSLHDFYYAIESLTLIKNEMPEGDVVLDDAVGIFQAIKALSQSDGRWRYSSDNPASSTYAAGMALEALAGVVTLASNGIGQSKVDAVKRDIQKLFDSMDSYNDGCFYFDEKVVGANGGLDPLSTTSSVVRGLIAFASTGAGRVNVPEDKILGLTKFFLSIGIPGDSKGLYNQINSLSSLESGRVPIPLIVTVPATVISLTNQGKLKVKVTTGLGSKSPPLKVKVVRVTPGSKDVPVIENQELVLEGDVYFLDLVPLGIDVGKYVFVFEIVLQDSVDKKAYATGGQTQLPIFVSGVIKIDSSEISILDSDLGSVDTNKKLNLEAENDVSLAANHLQKLRLSFQLSSPRGQAFKPHQAFLKLKHEKAEHIFLLGNTGKKFQLVLDFLGLVEKFYYLSGKYEIQLTVGDDVMENSFFQAIGHVELDLPEAPEKAPRPPLQPIDPLSKCGPKEEIAHIFRVPEKRPSGELSLAFVGLSLLPLVGFLIGLLKLGVNLKNFPTSPAPSAFAILFQAGIAAILALYALFWVKLDLFTTLKALGLLGVLVMGVGHRILSHLASASTKVKST